jgi:hypothetical protein
MQQVDKADVEGMERVTPGVLVAMVAVEPPITLAEEAAMA